MEDIREKVNQLNGLIEDFGFKSFIYEPGNEFITDCPSCIITVKYSNGETKEIDHYYGHISIDDSLTAFENRIERIIGTKKYVNPKLYIYLVEEKILEPSNQIHGYFCFGKRSNIFSGKRM